MPPDRSPPPGDAPEPQHSARAPSVTDPLIAASQSMVARRMPDLASTGFHKPLPTTGRIARLWSMLGLLLGRRLATVIRDDHVFIIVLAALVGVTSGAVSGNLTLLHPSDTLAGAMLAFARAEQEVLPVVDADRRLLGILRRGDLIAHYSDKVLGEQHEVVQITAGGRPDQELGVGAGIILERVVVGRRWAGRSLVELDLRGRTGVQVLEWSRGEGIMPLDPRAPLREGDVVALAGRRAELLAARELGGPALG